MASTIKKYITTLFSNTNNWQMQLLQNWPIIVGTIKTQVHLLKIYEDTLVIGVMDSCWLQELYLLTPLLLQTINSKLDKPRIKNLRFRSVGIFEEKKIKKTTKKRELLHTLIPLSGSEQAMLATIADDQLREVLKNYLIRCHEERMHKD